jgi:hypothetical protein
VSQKRNPSVDGNVEQKMIVERVADYGSEFYRRMCPNLKYSAQKDEYLFDDQLQAMKHKGGRKCDGEA